MSRKKYKTIFVNEEFPYEEFESRVTEDDLGGHLLKEFLVFIDDKKSFREKYESDVNFDFSKKTLAHSKFFAEMFYEAKYNPKCSYVSPFVDLAKTGYIPSKVYALKKNVGCDDDVYSELVCSRLFNFLEIPTVFNIDKRVTELDDYGEVYHDDYIISVDFLSGSQQFARFLDLNHNSGMLCEDHDLKTWLYAIEPSIKSFCKKNKIKLSKDNYNKIIEDFCEIYLIRNIIFDDFDFASRNIGIIYDNDGNICLAPQHDFERLFMGKRSQKYLEQCLSDSMAYMNKFCPDRLKSIMDNKVSKVTSGKHNYEIADIFNRCVPDDEYKSILFNAFFNNFKTAENVYNKLFVNSKEM